MAFQAIGPFTHPDPLKDESWPTALFVVKSIETFKGSKPFAGKDSLVHYEVYASQAKKNAGKDPRYTNTVPFDYVAANGNIIDQGLAAIKARPEYPGLVDA